MVYERPLLQARQAGTGRRHKVRGQLAPSNPGRFAEPIDQRTGIVNDHHLRCARAIERRSARTVRPSGHKEYCQEEARCS